MASFPQDQFSRPLGVLRLSLTARCNLACPYCLPDAEEPPDLLTPEERALLVKTAVGLGVHTLRLTGGEPLLHQGLEGLIRALWPLRRSMEATPEDPEATAGLRQIALTTNGVLLSRQRAMALKEAGLDRITISLDGADGASVARMAGSHGGTNSGAALLEKVLAAIEHARAAGFDPDSGDLKLNAVITRDGNQDQLIPLAGLARQRRVELRLIEFMDVGNRNGWEAGAVLPASEMVERIGRRWPLEALGRDRHGTASRWRYRDGGGQVAVVASISEPFCGDCNRLRITADGVAYTCLFASSGTDLRPWLRPHPDPAGLRHALIELWGRRSDRYSEERADLATTRRPSHAEMAYLGG